MLDQYAMENKTFWWLKSSRSDSQLGKSIETNENETSTPQIEQDISTSLAELIEKEQGSEKAVENEEDIGSIIEKMNRLAAQSPLGAYSNEHDERSVEEIMKEAERLYLESSKSFEQLSIHSKTSQNISEINSQSSEASTPTPKSASPLPLDSDKSRVSKSSESESYTDDFYEENKSSTPSPEIKPNKSDSDKENKFENKLDAAKVVKALEKMSSESSSTPESVKIVKSISMPSVPSKKISHFTNGAFKMQESFANSTFLVENNGEQQVEKLNLELNQFQDDMEKKEGIIKLLIEDNKKLKENIKELEVGAYANWFNFSNLVHISMSWFILVYAVSI